MKYAYCTLFDSNYLDKGILTIQSLIQQTNKDVIYVLCMDDKCFAVLSVLGLQRTVLIRIEEFLDDRYIEARSNRSIAEFCWTCTAGIISYVLRTYREDIVTYFDSDMFFYKNPNDLVREMIDNGKEVQIIEHGFSRSLGNRLTQNHVGKYCVEFNTFTNKKSSLRLLAIWQEKTLNNCSCVGKHHWGDQYYLNEWPDKYDFVNVLKNPGAGVAPWNINRYKLQNKDGNSFFLKTDNGDTCSLYFYHFENLKYISCKEVDINVFIRYFNIDKELVEILYLDYLSRLDNIKSMLKKDYGIESMIKVHPLFEAREKLTIVGMLKKISKIFTIEKWLYTIVFIQEKIKYKINHKKDIFTIN